MGLRFRTLINALIAGGVTAPPGTPAFTITLDNLVGLTGGGTTNVFMTGSTGGGGVITAKASASRLIGVAPLYVNFDATETTSTLSSNPSHELFFAWDFGDPGAGTWANGVQSPGLTNKNTAYGPVVGHVFETPGTYVVTPVVIDGDPAHTASRTKTIVVQDPNVVYAGALTICISHSGNFTGAPSGATQITAGSDDMYAAWNTHKASNKRILFCKADTWTCSQQMSLSGLTGTTVGGYGTGVAHTFASGTLVSVTPAIGATGLFECGGSVDCRVMEMRVSCEATHVAFYVASTDSIALTLYKIEVRGATCAISVGTGASHASFFKNDQHCTYECLNDQVYGYAGLPADTPRFAGAVGAVGTPGIFTATGHKFKRFNRVQLTGTPPAGLSTGTNYFISASNLTANTFSLTADFVIDAPLAITGAGTCNVTATPLGGGQGMFIGMTRGGIMGCYMDNCNNGEQALRIPYANTAHVNNNYTARPNQGKNVVKIHCRGYDDIYPETSGYSEKIVVTANVMDLRGGYSYGEVIPNTGQVANGVGTSAIVIGNGGPSPGGERVRNAIIENNFTYACLGYAKDSYGFVAVGCPNVTVRNNIADFSIGNRTTATPGNYPYTGMNFGSVGSSTTQERTVGVRFYNNTSYSNLSDSETANFVYIQLPSVAYMDVDDVQIKNNIWYYPFAITTSKSAYRLSALASPTNVVDTNNTDSVSGGSANNSPNFVATPPVALTDWRPTSGYAVNQGVTVPVLRDFNQASRVGGTYDLGAVLP